ncbi:MAG: DUF433 domain-containing protein [Acidobacteria bacterium]|nr:DUF433 domain-containing protein [Acidobacteriota bacterium]
MSVKKAFDPYGGRDPRQLPVYSAEEAGHYLWVPAPTIRSWVCGYQYPTKREGSKQAPRIVVPASTDPLLLSFDNLVELHVLTAIRRVHGLMLTKIRRALDYVRTELATPHPLLTEEFETDGVDLFVRRLGLLNASRAGQYAIEDVISIHLRRIERDERGLALKLFPFTRRPDQISAAEAAPRLIAIDARLAFGRPVIAGSRVPTQEIGERFWAGDSISVLAEEYGRSAAEIEEALRWERLTAA